MKVLPEEVNNRFVEVITSYMLNRVCNYINRKKYKEHITILNCFVRSLDEKYEAKFLELFEKSYNEQILGASKKEIFAAMKMRYVTPKEMSSKLGLSRYKFNNIYKELINRDFMTDEWLSSLKTVSDKDTIALCRSINSFVDNFQYLAGEPYYRHYELYRSIELEFYILHNTLLKILGSSQVVEKFLYNICLELGIDWSTISYLLRNLHIISRNDDIQINGNKQLKQEIFNLYYLKGFNKGDVGEYIFNKPRNTYYSSGYDYMTKDITNDEWEFSLTYTPTLDWAHIDKEEVLKFIDIFRSFTNEKL